MSTSNPNTEARYFASYIAERLNSGAPTNQISQTLVQNGMTPEDAAAFIDHVQDQLRRERRQEGLSTLILGIVLAAIGMGVYLATNYFFSLPGGILVLPGGLIAWGGWNVLKGLNTFLDNQQPKQTQG